MKTLNNIEVTAEQVLPPVQKIIETELFVKEVRGFGKIIRIDIVNHCGRVICTTKNTAYARAIAALPELLQFASMLRDHLQGGSESTIGSEIEKLMTYINTGHE